MPSTVDQTSDGAGSGLLGMLTGAELSRYGEIAHDQASAEFGGWRLGFGLAVGVLSAAALAGQMVSGVFDASARDGQTLRMILPIAAMLVGLVYLPYRRVKNWTLWNRHCSAVRDEQQRRQTALQRG